jgi:hypothetical protein
MSLAWIAAAALLAPPISASAASPGETGSPSYEAPADTRATTKKAERAAHVWRRDIADALRREATAIGDAREAAVLDLVDLYIELRDATTLADSEWERLGKTVQARLERVADKMQRQIDRAKKEAKAKPVKIHEFEVLGQVWGQQQAFGPPNLGNFGGFGGMTGIPGAANGDHGQELVDLIQKVIAPDTWDIAGGPGTIMYYSPQKVIVVRQTGEVHRQFGDVLRQLRQN